MPQFYDQQAVDHVEAVLDASPATAVDVYEQTWFQSERAIAAVAAHRAGGGGSVPVIGTSYLIATGAAQSAITCGDTSDPQVLTSVDALGSDISLSEDGETVTINTDGWYVLSAYMGNNGSAITSFQAVIQFTGTIPDPLPNSYDEYVGCDATVGGVDLLVTTPPIRLPAGTTFQLQGYADGTGTWNLEGITHLSVVRCA